MFSRVFVIGVNIIDTMVQSVAGIKKRAEVGSVPLFLGFPQAQAAGGTAFLTQIS